jgi:hypothetical protein
MKIEEWPNKLGFDVGPHEVHFLAGGAWGVRVTRGGEGWKWRKFDAGEPRRGGPGHEALRTFVRLGGEMATRADVKRTFGLGRIVATPGALELDVDLGHYIARHASGDWGDMCLER